ncbi:MAG TPA: DUF1839 family protein [Ktedonobacteraceae bacterium]|jgi:hypothetical protein|nr:DUF1839 family protein [Ktedonobacteraceae bacterium]
MNNIQATPYQAHWLHTGDGTWRQSNCYVDLWIEVLHSLSLNPVASFAFTPTVDFEGDQWTFFKVPLHDLLLLYGIDVQELNIWQSLLDHVVTQTNRNRLVLLEVDAFYLPDVSDTSYQQAHEKTTIGIQMVDPTERVLGYFHNSGYHTLHAGDFDGVFHVTALPPYAEYAKLDTVTKRTEGELIELATQLFAAHLSRCPKTNPFIAYSQQFQQYVAAEHDLASFHQYAFATMRQYGACYEYAALFLRWLKEYKGRDMSAAADHFTSISDATQILLLKTARFVKTRKPFDYLALLNAMQADWEQVMELMVSRC